MTPTARTLQRCRGFGWACDVCEKWSPFAGKRKDLFGFLDVIALTNRGILGIQATSQPNMSARINKIFDTPEFYYWMCAGGLCEVWGWGGDPEYEAYSKTDDLFISRFQVTKTIPATSEPKIEWYWSEEMVENLSYD